MSRLVSSVVVRGSLPENVTDHLSQQSAALHVKLTVGVDANSNDSTVFCRSRDEISERNKQLGGVLVPNPRNRQHPFHRSSVVVDVDVQGNNPRVVRATTLLKSAVEVNAIQTQYIYDLRS